MILKLSRDLFREESILEIPANISSLGPLQIMMDVPMVRIRMIFCMKLIMIMIIGNKFVIKQVSGVRKQFLILNGEVILGFVTNGEKFANCASYTGVTAQVDCKVY